MAGEEMIHIHRAAENNLKDITLSIPKNKVVVVTGVSGSGKSSLVFDVIYKEAESRYFSSVSSRARQFIGKLKRPEVEKITGLPPAISVDQQPAAPNPRSTVGTLTGIHDFLRLLYARTGKPTTGAGTFHINRSLFSFNTPGGACPVCKGLGVEDRLDPELLVADPSRTLREGALVITTPNGYIIYSQVTMDVLDQVCRAEGFHVDIPWKDLTDEQRRIVLYGSDRIEIPYGKHPLESRMRWSGITARPREMGYYKGIIPVMENILKVDRNKNILRFVRTTTCSACHGARLNEKALSVKVGGFSLAELLALSLDELPGILEGLAFEAQAQHVARPILSKITERVELMRNLGLGYLSCDRNADTLRSGESQRLRLAVQAVSGLSGLLYVFDEPSIGMHPREVHKLISLLRKLRDQGNTVIVVEHDEEVIRHADWLIDIGPGPGEQGGQVLLNMPANRIAELTPDEIQNNETLAWLKGYRSIPPSYHKPAGTSYIEITGASGNNLKDADARFQKHSLNVVSGVTGSGRSTLVHHTLGSFLRNKLEGSHYPVGPFRKIRGWEDITRILEIDQSPIGRTPRSNPATYTGLSDPIRDLFASLPESIEKGYGKSRFSFNTPGGRCETCQGAGYVQVGMHFMGNVEVLCETCNGRRFDEDTLRITWNGRNMYEILEMNVAAALDFFREVPKVRRTLEMLDTLGLGYLTLGQRSSTLSGGEAQRIRLAWELTRPGKANTLYILDEPTTGLHSADIANLIRALNSLAAQGNTIILNENHPLLLENASWVVVMGPGSGQDGGRVIYQGSPEGFSETMPGASGMDDFDSGTLPMNRYISFRDVTTHNLRHIDAVIPKGQLTVITGVSGSGKSSFAFDTLCAEGQNRFLESFSAYIRTRIGMKERPDFASVEGLTPVLSVGQHTAAANLRSTAGTLTGIYDLYRLLYSRIGRSPSGELPGFSTMFSFNHEQGACKTCNGLGMRIVCDPQKLITHPGLSILAGAMDGTKTGRFYGDPSGQYIATLKAAGERKGIDYSEPWNTLSEAEKEIVLYGTGDELYEVTWHFNRSGRTGEHHFRGPWTGLVNLVGEEYLRKHGDRRGEAMMNVMSHVFCPECHGTRLNPAALRFLVAGIDIAALSALSIRDSIAFFKTLDQKLSSPALVSTAAPLAREILDRLERIEGMGLSYLSPARAISTLSGGESHRIQLAGQMGSGLSGITYVLDEPTAGLHPSDVRKLMAHIRELTREGNTVVIVEHDPEVILSADHILELGPGAGRHGGMVVATGTPAEIMQNQDSQIRPWLTGEADGEEIPGHRNLAPGIRISQAFANNLKGFDLDIPSGGIIAITGVSGSGKSTLMFDVILASREHQRPEGCSEIEWLADFGQVIPVHVKSRFTGSQGTPATYTSILDPIRNLMASQAHAVEHHLTKNHFSFINKEGRCPECEGEGRIRVSMDFMGDVFTDCETCHGKRFREEILACHYNGKNIADILDMTVSEAGEFFAGTRQVTGKLALLKEVGLGYLQLGQPLDTLSGGEAHRLALAADLMKPPGKNCLYLFEEPATGLHPSDIRCLLTLFDRLVEEGHTLIVIEHDPMLIRRADREIRLGPGGGDEGGKVLYNGPN